MKIKLKNLILTQCIFLLLSYPIYGSSKLKEILERGELRVGTTGDWNPMTIIDPVSKKRVGFDIDLATALAKDMGIKLKFVTTTWKTLVNGIVSDKYDISTSASLSPKRALVAGYSNSYFSVVDVPLMNIEKKGEYKSWEDINTSNTIVAVTMGTVQEKRAKILFNKAKIITVSSPARDYQEILSGRADICMTSNLEASNLVKKYSKLMVVPVKEGRSPTPLAMLLPQNDQVWINYVNHWIKLKQEGGFFDEIETKWLKK